MEVFGGEEIINSTIHDNLASDEGGGVSVLFSDPFNDRAEHVFGERCRHRRRGSARGQRRVIVKGSTFQGNEGVLGGGIVANDQPTGSNDSVVDLRWSTISEYNSGSGGGIGGEDGGSFLSEGSVIHGNLAVGAQKDCNAHGPLGRAQLHRRHGRLQRVRPGRRHLRLPCALGPDCRQRRAYADDEANQRLSAHRRRWQRLSFARPAWKAAAKGRRMRHRLGGALSATG